MKWQRWLEQVLLNTLVDMLLFFLLHVVIINFLLPVVNLLVLVGQKNKNERVEQIFIVVGAW